MLSKRPLRSPPRPHAPGAPSVTSACTQWGGIRQGRGRPQPRAATIEGTLKRSVGRFGANVCSRSEGVPQVLLLGADARHPTAGDGFLAPVAHVPAPPSAWRALRPSHRTHLCSIRAAQSTCLPRTAALAAAGVCTQSATQRPLSYCTRTLTSPPARLSTPHSLHATRTYARADTTDAPRLTRRLVPRNMILFAMLQQASVACAPVRPARAAPLAVWGDGSPADCRGRA